MRWRFKKVSMRKLQGDVWIVQDKTGRVGYFKTVDGKKPYYAGTMIANEFITAALARRLGFPVARLERAAVIGPGGKLKNGLVSVQVSAREIVTWKNTHRRVKQNPVKYLNNVAQLKKLVVFDAWIANVDRAMGENLILYRNNPKDKYDWYLIDHANALLGSPYKWKKGAWDAFFWEQLWRFYHVPRGLLRLQSSRSLDRMINTIRFLSVQDIDKAIASAPGESLTKRKSVRTRRLLLYRKKKLRTIMNRWRTYKGRKEH